ncbi:MAG: hypothetical protein KGM44_05195 [bacterium]|nr:hypothetical protein [bacterium]
MVSTPLAASAAPTLAPAPQITPGAGLRVHTVAVAPVRARAGVHITEPHIDPYAGRRAAPGDPPRIFRLEISDDTVTPGETVSGKVVTTTNVAAVTARIATMSMRLRRDDFGVFTLTYRVPHLPFFLKRDYQIVVTAATADGRTATASLPISVH